MLRRTAIHVVARAALAGALVAVLAGPSRSQENLPPKKVDRPTETVKGDPGFVGADAKPVAGAGAANEMAPKRVLIGRPPRETVVETNLDLSDPATKRSLLAYRQKLYAYEIWSLEHTRRVYEWQHGKSEQGFWMVAALVALGVIMSWQQFRSDLERRARRHARSASGEPPAEAPAPPPTQFKASLQGIEVNSSLVGVVILAISLAFFYLYIVHVYTITPTN